MKTNLFIGDRVRISRIGLRVSKSRARHFPARTGTIVTDTLAPDATYICVHWDGNSKASMIERFPPEELVLYEEPEVAKPAFARKKKKQVEMA
jgi:hypothetical protein